MAADPFRLLPWRHIGHGYAISAAFGPTLHPSTHDALMVVANGYIIFHAIHSGAHGSGGPKFLINITDALVFDGLASVIIPTFLTFNVYKLIRPMCSDGKCHRNIFTWAPVIVSIASLALAWTHIDFFVDELLNQTIRQL